MDAAGAVALGCDIHLMVEYDTASVRSHWGFALSSERRRVVPFVQSDDILSLANGKFYIARNYHLFEALAGVRGSIPPLIPPRGFPSPCSRTTFNEFHLLVQNPEDGDTLWERGIWRAQAQTLLDRGKAMDASGTADGVWAITDPYFHGASWLTRAEILSSFRHVDLNPAELCVGFRVVLDALQTLDKEYGVGHSRIVFAFDN